MNPTATAAGRHQRISATSPSCCRTRDARSDGTFFDGSITVLGSEKDLHPVKSIERLLGCHAYVMNTSARDITRARPSTLRALSHPALLPCCRGTDDHQPVIFGPPGAASERVGFEPAEEANSISDLERNQRLVVPWPRPEYPDVPMGLPVAAPYLQRRTPEGSPEHFVPFRTPLGLGKPSRSVLSGGPRGSGHASKCPHDPKMMACGSSSPSNGEPCVQVPEP